MSQFDQLILAVARRLRVVKNEFEFPLDLGEEQRSFDRFTQIIGKASYLRAREMRNPNPTLLREGGEQMVMIGRIALKSSTDHEGGSHKKNDIITKYDPQLL